jgi:hypothetical protein
MEKLTHIDGMRFCLDLIQELKEKYLALGYSGYQLPIERVLADVENEIGYRAYREWRPR